jgi:hypothetical protein
MKGLAGVRLLRARLHFARRREQGQVWAYPLLKVVKLFHKLHRWASRGPIRDPEILEGGTLACPIPFREMVINCDGTVACGSTAEAPVLDALIEGAEHARLTGIWEGEAFRSMRTRMLAGDRSACQGCQLYRCPGFEPLSEDEQIQLSSGGRVPRIRQLLIEPTAVCNFDCPTICGHSFPKSKQPVSRRQVKFMPMNLFRQLVEAIDLPIDKICFYNYGEPLLHPEFSAMCRLMRERCPSSIITTSTNGSRLGDPGVRAGLLASGMDEIIISVDGASQATYEVYRRGGRFEDILQGMRLLKEERDRAGLLRPRILWRYILFPWNDSEEELAEAERLAGEIGVDRFCYHLSDLPEMASEIYRPGTEAFERIPGKLF